MSSIQLNEREYSVSFENETIQLLRKEFLLFSFLYKNKGHTFSRDELLDAVWQFESPTDRTVDDHIYRLRKKLKGWKNFLLIQTVKGYGYCLVFKQNDKASNPIINNKEFDEQTRKLFDMYYLYGQGKALQTLTNTQTLGFPVTNEQKLFLTLIKGDFNTIIEYAEFPHPQKMYLILYLYSYLEPDIKKVISIFEAVLEKQLLTDELVSEIAWFSLPFNYIKDNQLELAKEKINAAKKAVSSPEHGFYPLLSLLEAMTLLRMERMVEVKRKIEDLELFFEQRPYQRELGMFTILKGLHEIALSNNTVGKKFIDQGLEVIENSGHSYYFLFAYNTINHFLTHYDAKGKLLKGYKKMEDSYYKEYQLFELKPKIFNQVNSFF